ncbi:hypothetical protein GCK32_020756 [Trichostrongylus colubriformis]|uniref:Uncharacterized protein n=1 Tax=Trichostrongylus colubriformis TaxID=6319 RepID=A0AAN8J238_TRICO
MACLPYFLVLKKSIFQLENCTMDDQLLNQISKDIVDSVLPVAQEDLAKLEHAQAQNAVVSEKSPSSETSPGRRATPPPSPVSTIEDHFEVKKISPDTTVGSLII